MSEDGPATAEAIDLMNYGKAIRIVRAARGLTQRELAGRLTIGPSQLSLVEAGKRRPSIGVLDEIASAMQVPPHLLTVLASEPDDIEKRIDPTQLAELATSLLELLVKPQRPAPPTRKKSTGGLRRAS